MPTERHKAGRRQLPRRKRLILRYTLIGLAPLLLLTVVLFRYRLPDPYSAGEAVEGLTRSLDRDLPPGVPAIRFEDVAAESGIRFRHFPGQRSTQLPEDMGSGAAWGDYDGDGRDDLYVNNIARALDGDGESAEGSNRLYRNRGDGSFEDVTEKAGVGFRGVGMASAWADFDNDGDLDLAVTNYGPILLYENQGDGTFSDASARLGPANQPGFWTGASWGDYDRDGDPDLYVCGYVQYRSEPEKTLEMTRQFSGLVPYTLNPSSYPPQANLLFENRQGGFLEVAQESGVANPRGRSLAASWADFDNDGWLDLYVANDVSDNVLYRNLKTGRFEDVSHKAWVADYRGAMGLAVGDWDLDTDLDIFVTHWIAQENAFYNNLRVAFGAVAPEPHKLLFMDIADQVGLGQIALDFIGWGTSFLDYDNDGRLDLFVANGSTFQREDDPRFLIPMSDQLFWNRGEEGFFDVSSVSGPPFGAAAVGRGAAFSDYDGDGDVDVAVVNHGAPLQLLRNSGGENNWLKVRVRASGRNRNVLGALVEVEWQGKKTAAQIGSQASYLSQNSNDLVFGLGEATLVESVRVTLPDGRSRTLTDLRCNQTLLVELP